MSDRPRIRVEKDGHVRLIALDRADKRNAFDLRMLRELAEAYTAFEEDDEARAAVVYGAPLRLREKPSPSRIKLRRVWPYNSANCSIFAARTPVIAAAQEGVRVARCDSNSPGLSVYFSR